MGMLIMVGVLKAKAIATNLNSLIYWNFDLGVRTPELDVRTPEIEMSQPQEPVNGGNCFCLQNPHHNQNSHKSTIFN